MAKETTGIQNEGNMSPKEARNFVKWYAEQQGKNFNLISEKCKGMMAEMMREGNKKNPTLQKAIQINKETTEIIRQNVKMKLNKDTITPEEWQQALEDFYEEKEADDSKSKDHSKEKEKFSRELPAGLPEYAYEVDKNFKNETRRGRNSEMMKKIDEVVLKMREEGIIKTESKDGGVYTTIKFPNEKPIHFLEPDLSKYSGKGYFDYDFSFGGRNNVHKTEVVIDGIRGTVDEWKNEELKQYVEQSGLRLPKEITITLFINRLSNYANQYYGLNISREDERIDLFCRAMNSIGYFWVENYINSRFYYFVCEDTNCGFNPYFSNPGMASFFLTDYLL